LRASGETGYKEGRDRRGDARTRHMGSRDGTSNPAQLRLFGDEADARRETGREEEQMPADPADGIALEALDHLNAVTERTGAARFTSPTSIKERIKSGAALEDLLLVIDFCRAMWWGDAKMETYIRPKTLFGKENFPEYLVRARKWDRDGRPSLLGGAAKEGAGDRRLEAYSAHVKGGTP